MNFALTVVPKIEIFDRTIANRLLKEDSSKITPEEKKLVSKLLRKSRGNELEVKYKYTKGYANLQIGRVYAEGSLSLGCMKNSSIRAPMCEKYYHDIDVVNCHYTIAYQYAKNKGLEHNNIKQYVENREECLNQVMEEYKLDRTDAKLLYLKIAYGGNLPENLECSDESTYVDLETINPKLSALKNEMNKLATYVWDNNKSWHELPNKNHLFKQSGPNKKYKFLSVFLQTEERKILEAMNKYFTSEARSVDILIHDGCMIRKHENESKFPRDLMDKCQDFIKEMTTYEIKLEQKPVIMDWDFSESVLDAELSSGFWKTHFFMNGELYRELDNESKPKLVPKPKLHCAQFAAEFNTAGRYVLETVAENQVRQYDRFDFCPYGEPVPDKVYNTFIGMAWTGLYNKPGLLSNEQYYNLIDEIKITPWSPEQQEMWSKSKTKWQIEEVLCYNQEYSKQLYNITYFMNTLGQILFNPTKPTEKVLCLRNEQGGSGKTGLLERHFAAKLLGETYFGSYSQSKTVFGEFNGAMRGKLFILCEEANTKDTKEFTEHIKAAVTRKRNPIRLMRTDTFEENNYCTYIANTNKQTAFEFDPKNRRRFPQIDCKEYTLTQEDEMELCKETNSPVYNKLFLEYILAHYNPEFDFNKHPESESVEQLKEQFKSPIMQFFDIILFEWDDFYTNKILPYFIHCKDNLDLHKLDVWTVKAELFCEIFKEVMKFHISPEFSSKVKFAAFRQNKELVQLMKDNEKLFIKKIINYEYTTPDDPVKKQKKEEKLKDKPKDLGTYYILHLKELRQKYQAHKSESPKRTIAQHFENESFAKKQKTASE